MSAVFAVTNQKGGVGKTTTVVNLAAAVAIRGRRVLVIDTDPQANATSALGYDRKTIKTSIYDVIIGEVPLAEAVIVTTRLGLDLVPAATALAGAEVELVSLDGRERRLRRALTPLRERYDLVLIDCPPSLGLLTINAMTAADGLIVPLQCEYLALEGLGQLLNTVQRVRANLNSGLRMAGVVLTMFDPRLNLAQQVVEEVRRHFPQELFHTIVPRSVRLSEAPSFGQTIFEYDSGSKGAAAYRFLAEELLSRLGMSVAAGQGG